MTGQWFGQPILGGSLHLLHSPGHLHQSLDITPLAPARGPCCASIIIPPPATGRRHRATTQGAPPDLHYTLHRDYITGVILLLEATPPQPIRLCHVIPAQPMTHHLAYPIIGPHLYKPSPSFTSSPGHQRRSTTNPPSIALIKRLYIFHRATKSISQYRLS